MRAAVWSLLLLLYAAVASAQRGLSRKWEARAVTNERTVQHRLAVRGGKSNNVYPAPRFADPVPQNFGQRTSLADPRLREVDVVSAQELAENQQRAASQKYAEVFLDRNDRMGFVRKVYLSLTLQLAVTAAVCIGAQQRKNTLLPWLMYGEGGRLQATVWSSFAVSIGSILALSSNTELRQRAPGNLALLSLFTLAESALVATITLMYSAKSVWLALIQTAAATLGLSLYAFQTNPKYDLTGLGAVCSSGITILLLMSVVRLAFPRLFAGSELLMSTGAAILFSCFIVYDTQRVIGGKHRQSDQIDKRDWVMGSVALYMDIITLFVELLRIFGKQD